MECTTTVHWESSSRSDRRAIMAGLAGELCGQDGWRNPRAGAVRRFGVPSPAALGAAVGTVFATAARRGCQRAAGDWYGYEVVDNWECVRGGGVGRADRGLGCAHPRAQSAAGRQSRPLSHPALDPTARPGLSPACSDNFPTTGNNATAASRSARNLLPNTAFPRHLLARRQLHPRGPDARTR